MNKTTFSIDGKRVSAGAAREQSNAARREWLAERRGKEFEDRKRQHRAMMQWQREEKAMRTAAAKARRKAERDERERDQLLRRIGYLSRRSLLEESKMLRVNVSVWPSARAKLSVVCPKKLYNRQAPLVRKPTGWIRPSGRMSSDGYRNIVLKVSSRGFKGGRNAPAYRAGDAANLARYILRPEGAENGILAYFTNVTTPAEGREQGLTISLPECEEVVDFCRALESHEHVVDPNGNVVLHLILALPYELSPEGRSAAMKDIGDLLDELHLPYVASAQKADPNGDDRNFHGHFMVSTRPFRVEGDGEWSFEACKASELNSPNGIKWLRRHMADIFNCHLAYENSKIRYSGVSQADRGVEASTATAIGQGANAVIRKDEAARMRVMGAIAAYLSKKLETVADLRGSVAIEQQKAKPTYLERIRAKFPNPMRLDGISAADFEGVGPTDLARDDWYFPTYVLHQQLLRDEEMLERCIAVEGKSACLVADELPDMFKALASEESVPDIIDDILREERLFRLRREKEKHYNEKIRASKVTAGAEQTKAAEVTADKADRSALGHTVDEVEKKKEADLTATPTKDVTPPEKTPMEEKIDQKSTVTEPSIDAAEDNDWLDVLNKARSGGLGRS
ncbi:MobA/MobL family protein [Sphingomicrobium sp. XHP0235]|uniref:MobA/MobL family protein n=1 Tax=Sphingomicrobium aquimarinum TaxID=3133971 RepID=UPI0031FEFE2C